MNQDVSRGEVAEVRRGSASSRKDAAQDGIPRPVEIGQLAAQLAHEARNVLTSIGMRVYSLRQALGHDPALSEDLDVIAEEAGHLEAIFRHFLRFSAPPPLAPEQVSVAALVASAARLVEDRYARARVRLVARPARDLPDVLADPDQLKGVLLNLLLNALEASPPGTAVEFEAAGDRDGSGDGFVTLWVRDQGCGIAAEDRPRVFRPYFTTKPDGTGLGLSMARQIVEQHGGALSLESTSPAGTVFAIRLPALERST